ncbi:hypothetical protein J3E68DRAFT_228583 [Trichoderma sp. SZMC 28012]
MPSLVPSWQQMAAFSAQDCRSTGLACSLQVVRANQDFGPASPPAWESTLCVHGCKSMSTSKREVVAVFGGKWLAFFFYLTARYSRQGKARAGQLFPPSGTSITIFYYLSIYCFPLFLQATSQSSGIT